MGTTSLESVIKLAACFLSLINVQTKSGSNHLIALIRKFTYVLDEAEMGGPCSTNGRNEKFIKILVRKPNGKRTLRRPRCIWEGNIRMDLREIGWEDVDWIHLVQDRV